MSNQYSGGLITKTPTVPTSISAPGIWTLSQQAAAQATNTWPFPRDPYFKNVTMLLHGDGSAGAVPTTGVGAGASTTVAAFDTDASTNNFNITINGDARSNNFTPYQAGYYSNYFDGSGDYLTLPDNSAWVVDTDYTIEFWCYASSFPSQYNNVFNQRASPSVYWGVNWDTSLGWCFFWNNGSGETKISRNQNSPLNTWVHFAFVKSGTTGYMFLNGVQAGATFTIGSINDMASLLYIGTWPTISDYFAGYISNMRFVKGTALYTSTFTPSTTPLTAITNTVLLTCQSNRFIDNSTNAFTITKNGDTAVSPAQPFTLPSSVATYGSGFFDGSGDYLSIANQSALHLGGGDFSIECWTYLTSTSGAQRPISQNDSNYEFAFYIANGGDITAYSFQSSGTQNFGISGGTLVTGQWYHLACTRTGSTVAFFVNGVRQGTASFSGTVDSQTAGWDIGAIGAGTDPQKGYITDVRMVFGSNPYGVGTTLTLPTAPLTAITNTQLLTTQYNGAGNNSGFKDSSQNNFVITRNGNTTQGTFTPYEANWSNYFNGTTDYLQVAYNSALDAGTGPFTYEAWLNPSTTTNKQYLGGSVTNAFFAFVGSGTIFVGRNNVAVDFTSSSGIVTNQWNHVVIVRNASNNIAIFINGVSAYYAASNTNNYGLASNPLRIGVATTGSSYEYNGYISNVRIAKSALYDPTASTITVPTAPLTPVSGTALLTCQGNRFVDNSSNAFAITRNGSPSVQSFSPFAPLVVYNPAVNGGSAYFDGSGDYLTTATTSIFLGTNNFTMECWVYPTTSGDQIVFDCRSGSNSNKPTLGVISLQLAYQTSGANRILAGSTPLNAWSHLAIIRNNNVIYAYINGVQVGTYSDSSDYGTVTRLRVGCDDDGGPSAFFGGYISDARFVTSAVYTSAFTPPTAPLTAIAGTSLLLSTTNPAIFDNAMMNNLETVGNAQVSTTVKKFGAASMYFDGTSSNRIKPPASSLYAFGTGNFTVEAWIYVNSLVPENFVFDTRSSVSTAGMGFNIEPSTGKLRYSGSANNVLTSTSVSTGVWTHVAWVRNNGTLTGYINGVSGGSASNSDNLTQTNGEVGNVPFSSVSTNMYIDDLRITRGVARYTANFTVPDQAFPNG